MGEEGTKRVVAGDDETSQVGQKLASEVEDNEEEVESADTDGGIGLGNTSLLLEVVEGGVLGELYEWYHRQHFCKVTLRNLCSTTMRRL